MSSERRSVTALNRVADQPDHAKLRQVLAELEALMDAEGIRSPLDRY